jgi:hypothetical protein
LMFFEVHIFSFFGSAGIETRAFSNDRQALYH